MLLISDTLRAVFIRHSHFFEAVPVHLVTAFELRLETMIVLFQKHLTIEASYSVLRSMIVQVSHVYTDTSLAVRAVEEVLPAARLTHSALCAVELPLGRVVVI